ncbi:unnamed protein product, partial [Mesorhabditis spiculigera]
MKMDGYSQMLLYASQLVIAVCLLYTIYSCILLFLNCCRALVERSQMERIRYDAEVPLTLVNKPFVIRKEDSTEC